MRDHTCDRKGPPAKVIDESGDEATTYIYPTCSVCGVPQVFDIGARTERLTAQLETLSSQQRELITRLVDLLASMALGRSSARISDQDSQIQ
jgi:cation diffusion facilitator CzcD-associated flavoprotein CzcO